MVPSALVAAEAKVGAVPSTVELLVAAGGVPVTVELLVTEVLLEFE